MRVLKTSSSNSSETKKIRKILNEEIRLGINASSDTETEDVDLNKEIYPLSHYINNREEMIEQMFSIIKGDKLKKMVPPLLRDTPLDELKADCLIHLLGMSKKRILSILEGKEIKSSSDSETSSDSSHSPKKKKPFKVQPIVIKQEGCSDISDNSEEVVLIDPDSNLLGETSKKIKSEGSSRKAKKRRKKEELKRNNSEDQIKKSKKNRLELKKSNEDEKTDGSHKSVSENENDEVSAPTEGKTLLEILELEMRARAIRALLQKGGAPEVEEQDANNIDNTAIPVDVDDESSNEKSSAVKITPIKNFRKNKRSNDDVIVITPKLVTIDLTDENDASNLKNSTKDVVSSNLELNSLLSMSDVVKENLSKSPQRTDLNSTESSGLIDFNDPKSDNGTDKTVVIPKTASPSENITDNPGNPLKPNTEKNTDQPKSNWAQRWLESKEVKKVVSTSKICGNIRKRIKRAKLAQHVQDITNQDSCSSSPTVEQQIIYGSVDEYQSLPKSCNSVGSNKTQSNTTTQKSTELCLEEQGEKVSSVEQVQDVTSTKNELLKEPSLQEDSSDRKLGETCDATSVSPSDISDSKAINSNLGETCDATSVSPSDISDSKAINSNLGETCDATSVSPSDISDSKAINLTDSSSIISSDCALSSITNLINDSINKVDVQSLDSNPNSPTIEENSFDTQSNLIDISAAEPSGLGDVSNNAVASETNMDNDDTKIITFECEVTQINDQISSSVISSNTECSELKVSELVSSKHELNHEVAEINTKESEKSTEIFKITCSSSFENDKTVEVIRKHENTNEPETLEIDVTDEDREIDGMMDEKVELDQATM